MIINAITDTPNSAEWTDRIVATVEPAILGLTMQVMQGYAMWCGRDGSDLKPLERKREASELGGARKVVSCSLMPLMEFKFCQWHRFRKLVTGSSRVRCTLLGTQSWKLWLDLRRRRDHGKTCSGWKRVELLFLEVFDNLDLSGHLNWSLSVSCSTRDPTSQYTRLGMLGQDDVET